MPSSNPASQYTLLEKLGTGSFGTVYKAIHNETKQIVAIKQIGTLPTHLFHRCPYRISIPDHPGELYCAASYGLGDVTSPLSSKRAGFQLLIWSVLTTGRLHTHF